MWNKIIDIKTGRKVDLNTKFGRRILIKYIKQLGAGYGNIYSDMEDYYSDSDSEDYSDSDSDNYDGNDYSNNEYDSSSEDDNDYQQYDNNDGNGLFGNYNNPQGQEFFDEDEIYAEQYYHITLRSRLPNIRRQGILSNCNGTINVACSGKIYVLKREDNIENHRELMDIYSHIQARVINSSDEPVILLINKNQVINNNVIFSEAESIEINGRYIQPFSPNEYTTSDPIYDFDILDTNQFLDRQRQLGLW
jgi:hypothetical protein